MRRPGGSFTLLVLGSLALLLMQPQAVRTAVPAGSPARAPLTPQQQAAGAKQSTQQLKQASAKPASAIIKATPAQMAAVAAANHLTPGQYQYSRELKRYVVKADPAALTLPKAVAAAPGRTYLALGIPNDPLYNQQYAPAQMSLPAAWDTTTGQASEVIAVIDTGFALNHEDLAGKWWTNPGESGPTTQEGPAPNCTSRGLPLDKSCNNLDDDGDGYVDDWRGWDFANGDNDVSVGTTNPSGEYASHGTMTASLAAANTNNGKGIAGMCWTCTIMPVQVLSDDGTGDTGAVASGVRYAADHGANVISMSLGSTDADPTLQDAISYAIGKGCVVVAAAGNGGPGNMVYPALYPGVIAVGASDSNDQIASWSSTGPQLSVVAPGVNVLAAYWTPGNTTTGYAYGYGTSMSTPEVAGVAALLLSQNAAASPSDVLRWLENGADKVGGMNGASFTDSYGYGRVNALGALKNYSYSIVSQAAYTDSGKSTPLDLTKLSPGQTGWLTLQVKNTGDTSWSNSGSNPVDLGTDNPRDHASRFATAAWMGANRPARLSEASVAPNDTGTFEWPFRVPPGGGDFHEYVTPVAEGVTWMNTTGLNYSIHVNSSYSWQVAGQYAYTDSTKSTGVDMTHLSPGQRIYIGVLAKNTGDTSWYNTGSNPVRLGTDDARDHASAFCDRSSWIGCNRPSTFTNSANPAVSSVAPGETAEFGYWYDIPALNGTYHEHFTPVAEGVTWMNDLGLNFYTVVNGSYAWDLISQAAYSDASLTAPANLTSLKPGDVTYWQVRGKNTGTATWYNSGNFPLDLGTSHPADRSSAFCDDSSWLGCNRPVRLQETSVAPGQTGTFIFKAVAPNIGTYLEYFDLVTEGITWLNDPGMNFYTVVK